MQGLINKNTVKKVLAHRRWPEHQRTRIAQ
jgi:hypothetical protein